MSAEEQVTSAPSVSENPEVLADQPTSMVTDEDPATNGAPVRWFFVVKSGEGRLFQCISKILCFCFNTQSSITNLIDTFQKYYFQANARIQEAIDSPWGRTSHLRLTSSSFVRPIM